ncbi:SDR family oxidoreductase [Cupriavidus sp. D39]|uniref:SDR family oxidoreductase n=1 Tax=Cupriavidus sp. D39 TaxID=2997877 RepID=UPI0022711CA7|nr:SDR family oxidoreductase [Cupriavidus sp. D39]MCY0853768.1 SDR family oxidoreductase [Cupriavidus sp. D39]
MDLRKQVAIVTGASSGIGQAIARELSAAGASLVITARREDRLAALSASLPGPSVRLCAAVEGPGTPQALLDLAMAEFGRADVLVNNAGMFVAGSLDTIDMDDVARMTRVNFDAVVRASYLFARAFKRQGSGAIVNVSSIGAYLSSSSVGAYSGLKHALEVFTSALRVELKGSGVRIGTIAPGTTETEIFDRLRASGQAVLADQTPPLDPADVAAAVRFMLTQPERANVARLLLVSSAESV